MESQSKEKGTKTRWSPRVPPTLWPLTRGSALPRWRNHSTPNNLQAWASKTESIPSRFLRHQIKYLKKRQTNAPPFLFGFESIYKVIWLWLKNRDSHNGTLINGRKDENPGPTLAPESLGPPVESLNFISALLFGVPPNPESFFWLHPGRVTGWLAALATFAASPVPGCCGGGWLVGRIPSITGLSRTSGCLLALIWWQWGCVGLSEILMRAGFGLHLGLAKG